MDIKETFKGNAGLLLAAVSGAVLGNLIPTPSDALTFHLRRKLRDKWTRGEISSKKYWGNEAIYYYGFNSTWWALVGIATYLTPGDAKKKIRTLLALTGAGIVFSVLYKNIKKDEKEMLPQQNAFKQKMMETVDPAEFEQFCEEVQNKIIKKA